MRAILILAAMWLVVGAAICLSGCAPTQFVLGDVTKPPYGCTEARERGHEC